MIQPRILPLLLALIPTAALATNVSGPLSGNTTWTPAGNPWVLTGDVTVPTGVTLTIDPGVQITFASTDGRGSGNDTTKVELIVVGTLKAQGTSAAPISITATNAYGVSIEGSASFDYTHLTGGLECLGVYSGTLSFTHGTIQNCFVALGTAGGTTTFTNNVVRGSGSTAQSTFALEIGAPISLIHNTITGNNYGGVRIYQFGGSANVYDNIIAANGQYGLSFYNPTTPTRVVHHNDVWNHSASDYTNVAEGTGGISANPLFVSSTNFRITEYSPARLAASDGTDMGAFAYAGDPATSLQGSLVADKTLTGANTLAGDLTVRPGVTLTLAAGASLTFAATDGMRSGEDPAKVELIAHGTLNAEGTSTTPVTITATGGMGTAIHGSASFNYTTLNGGSLCLSVTSGTLSFTHGTIQGCTTALMTMGGSTNVLYSLVRNNGNRTQGNFALDLLAPTNLIHNTFANNSEGAIRVYGFGGAVNIYDNIITSNDRYGLSFYNSTNPTRAVHHNDVWNHSASNYSGVTAGTGSISADPLFVSSTNFNLQATSPCRNIASDGTDLGAFPYAPVRVAYVVVTPSPASLAVQGTRQFSATAYDASNNPLPFPITWSATSAAGSIDSNGLFTASCTPGTYTAAVTATSDGKSASADVTLTPGAASAVTVSPSNATVQTNGTQQFTANVTDACNNPLPTAPVSWVVTTGGGTINASGLFTAGSTPGTFPNTVRAFSGTLSGTASVTVTSPLASIQVTPSPATLSINGTQQFTATGKDSAGNTVPVSVTWSVVNGGGAIDASGLFTAGTTPGTFTNTLKATSGAISAFVTVTVQPGALASIEVTPSDATLSINGTQQFTATGKDSAGNTVPVSVTWSVANGGGSINSTGLFTAGTAPGTFVNTVRASSGTLSGFASVTVQPGALASIEVTPDTTTLGVNGSQQFTATGKDSAGNTVPVSVTWSVANGGGSISSTGLFTAGATTGTFTNTIKATSGTVSGFATVTVQPGALASVEVAPSSVTLPIHGTQQLTATGKDSAGNTVSVSVTWSVVNGGGTINATGLFTAGTTPGTYASTIKATSNGISGFATVTVQPGALASITVTPNTATLPISGEQQFTATGRDSAGNTVSAAITWSVVNGGGAIDASGLFTAGTTPGTFTNTIKASSGGVSGLASVTVQPGALASLELTPGSATLAIKGTQQFTATGRDSAGNVVPAAVTWSVANGGGSIDATGLFTASTVAGTFAQTVKATSGSLSATASVTVNPGPVQNVAVTPASVTLPVRGTRQFTVTATDAWGNTVSGTPTWAVLPATAGTIDATGFFTAGNASGSYLSAVTATLSGVSGSADVTISASALARIIVSPAALTVEPRSVRQFSAQGQDADGNVVPITPVWSVVNGAGSITQDGVFTATQVPGTYPDSVVATANGVTGTTSVTVTVGGIQRVALSPLNPTVAVNGKVTFSAKAFDAFDNELPALPATWEVVNGGGSIDASGVFTAGTKSGTFTHTVKVTLGGSSTTTSVTVATDSDGDGLADDWEVAHGLDPTQPGDGALDPDADRLSNLSEFQTGTNPRDADTDDDGVLDGNEQSPSEDTDNDGRANALDPDSDDDRLFDGTEMAVFASHANTDTSNGSFIADADPATSTAPLLPDTDKDGRKDGEEDANHNGKVDSGETDPNHADTFCAATPECGGGQSCENGVCVDDGPSVPEEDSGCGCSGSGPGASLFSLLLLALLGRLGARRERA
ncbi:beta strand repeat-containing protein [Hyalangium gracile]|uniref:beta strand repeat-containing protein n=1 Tax=Hyalangium gracile TaxID=394092 RepID=UPI001CCC7398|nr:hypothetical protein [Hyalangium gracile]